MVTEGDVLDDRRSWPHSFEKLPEVRTQIVVIVALIGISRNLS